MSDEPKTPESDETPTEPAPEKPKASWEYKTEFGINARMREVIETTIKVAEAEVASYKRKIEKLTYGS